MKRPLFKALKRAVIASLFTVIALQGQSQPILDLLSTSPSVAYSLRQLKSSATRAIQVRRSSDGLTMDIGFTAGGDLDQAALLSFVGSNNGYITIWYDQSGNGHDAIQATAAKQPRIVNAGVVDVQNGRPVCDFNGSTSTMATTPFALTTPLSVFLVSRRTGAGTSSTGYVTMFDGGNNNTFKIAYPNTSNPASMGLSPQDWSSATSLQPVPQLSSNALFMYSALCDASSGVQYLNGGVQYHNFPGATANLNGIRLFRGSPLPADNELPAGQLSEVVVFGSKLSNADRQLLDCSQSNYYSIQIVPAGLDLAITSGSSTSTCSQVKEDVAWQASSLNNVYATGNQLIKYQSNSWDGGAASWNTVSNNGYFQFTANETNLDRMAGLSTSHTSNSYTTIQYAWFLTSGDALQIYESGIYKGSFGSYSTGDVLKVGVEGGMIKYYKNGVLMYISNTAPTLPMVVDVSLNDKGSTIAGATVTNYSSGTFTASAVNAGASPGYQWLLNGAPVGTNSNTYTNTSLNAGDVVSCVLTPNIPGCGALTATSNNVTAAAATPANTEFYIQGTPAATGCGTVMEQVKWNLGTLVNGVSVVSTNSLSKFQYSGWNGGAASWNTVSNNGYLQVTASETNKAKMVGLSTAHTSSSYTTIQYAFYETNSGNLAIYESGNSRGTYGTYTPGDVLKISVENNVVKYYKNGTLLYISLVAPTLPLLVDVSIYDAGGTVSNALVSNYNAGVFTATTVNAGASPTFQWMVNGVTMQTGASATYTNTGLNNGDVVTCTMTPGLAGCSSIPVASNTITEAFVSPVNVDFSIQGVAATTNCNTVIEQVKWKLANTTSGMAIDASGNPSKFQNIMGSWDCAAYSWNTVSNNGYFQFTVTETNKTRAAGLSAAYTGVDYTNLQYGFYLNGSGALQIFESGSGRGTFGTYATGDILKISVENNVVKYYQNGNLLYVSNITPTLPLAVQASMYNTGSSISNALVSNYNAGTFIANTANAGAAPIFQWKVNGVTVQTGASATYTNTGLASGDIVTCVMTPNLPGCSNIPQTSNTVKDTVVAPINVDLSIQGTAAVTNCGAVLEQVKWKLSNTTTNMTVVSTNSLSKFQSTGWDGGAGSWNTVSDNGYLQFIATETNTARMAGLSTSYTGSGYPTIQYALYLTSSGTLQIYESGSGRGSFGNYATGDVLKIAVEGGVVKYYKNGTLLYISSNAPTLPMVVDVSMYHPGATISNAQVFNYNAGAFTANTVNAGANPTFRWMVNGSTVQTGPSATYTNTGLTNGDVVSCEMTPDLAGCAAAPVVSNTIKDTVVAPINMDLSIQGVAATPNCNAVVEQVKWKLSDLNSNLVASGSSVSRFQYSGWNAGVSSWNTVSNNGYFQFTATETNKDRMAGLSTSFTGNSYTTIQYAFYLTSGGNLAVYESGSSRGTFGTYTTGDVLKIAVESNVVRYYKNGTQVYVSPVAPVLPLLVDVSINSSGGSIGNALVSNYNAGVFTANTANAGVNPTFQWMVNGVAVQTGPSATYTNASLNNGDIVTCMLTPDLAGCNLASTYTSNTITNSAVPPLNVDFAILGTAATSNCAAAVEQVKWKLSNLSSNMNIVSVNGLSKFQNNGVWDGGAASWNTVSNNGYFQFTASETTTGRMAGLSSSYTSASYTTIQYAFYLQSGGGLQIYESGGSKGAFGTYTTGDIMKVAVENNVVKYYKNGTLLYASTVAPTLPLLVDASIRDASGTISNAVVSNYSTGTFTASTVNAGTNPTFQWMVNGVTVQTGASATYTNTGLSNNDVITCVLTPDLPGCSVTTYNSNTITNTATAPLNLDFSIQGAVDPSSCTAVIEQVKWKLPNLSANMNIVSVNGLSKFQSNGNWDGGAASWNTVSNNGYFQFTASETNTNRMAGLSSSYTSASYTTIQYAFYLATGSTLQIYESGIYKAGFTYTTGDVLKIAVENNVVKYYKNGALLRTSPTAPTLPMLVDVSINSSGGTITNAFVSNLNSGTFTASAVNAGSFPNYQWQVNGATVQTGLSATYTNASLASGDVVTCILTPNLPGCTAGTYPSNTVTAVKSGASTTWTGATSNSWFTASNWSAGLPDRFTSAVIAGGMPNNPTISSDASVYDITINSGATLTMSGTPILSVYRNWTNNGAFVPGTGTVTFVSCSSPAVINSTGAETFYNLMINTPYGVTIASGTQQVSKQMTFVTGIVTQSGILTFLNGSTVSGATDASHVNGVVTKVGTGAFTFPVGDNTSYRPIAMSSPSLATDVFTAQYIYADPDPTYSRATRDITLNNVSQHEYWMLNRTNGASNVTVNLSWNINSGSITSMGALHVTGWSTALSKWKDLGSSGTTGNTGAGTVTSSGAVSTFGAFTLASLTVNNILPVDLLYFQCNKINASLVDIGWSTSSEQNSSYFVVERSSDGQHFESIQTVPAADNSSLPLTYVAKDSRPLKGVSYYRLKLVDLDGSSVYSEVRAVNISVASELTMYPNPTTDRVFIGLNDNKVLKVTVFDNLGREMLAVLRPVDAVLAIDVSRLAAGMYHVVIDLEDKSRVTKKLLIKR